MSAAVDDREHRRIVPWVQVPIPLNFHRIFLTWQKALQLALRFRHQLVIGIQDRQTRHRKYVGVALVVEQEAQRECLIVAWRDEL